MKLFPFAQFSLAPNSMFSCFLNNPNEATTPIGRHSKAFRVTFLILERVAKRSHRCDAARGLSTFPSPAIIP